MNRRSLLLLGGAAAASVGAALLLAPRRIDQHDIARLDNAAQLPGVAGGEWLVTRNFLLQVARDQLADGIEHEAHDLFPPAAFLTAFSLSLSWSKAVAI